MAPLSQIPVTPVNNPCAASEPGLEVGHCHSSVHRIPGPNFDFKKKREITECPHTDRPYYAKGMCVNCYHRQGRTKKAWNCPHTNKTHYSKGLCKYCYLANYYKNRTIKRGRKPS